MKRRIGAVAALWALAFGAGAAVSALRAPQSVDADDPRLSRTGLVWRLDGRPLSGTLRARRADGGLTMTPLRDGFAHGVEKSWYADGRPQEEREYRQGRKAGTHRGWWPDGAPRFEYEFVDGLTQGLARSWYANGRLFEEHRYERGHEAGLQRLWHEDGRPRANYEVRDGRRYGYIGGKPCASMDAEPAA